MESLDPQWIFNVLFSIVGALFGWLLNSIRDSMRELKQQDELLTGKVQHIEVLIAGSYVKRGDLEKMCDNIYTKLDRIETKIDQKMDKP